MSKSTEPLLKLSTLLERETIELKSKRHPNGKLYELRNLADLGPLEHARISACQTEVQELHSLKKKATAAQKKRVDELLDVMVNMIVLELEPSVLREMTRELKETVILCWAAAISAGAAEGNASRRLTGGGSSRGSRRSTAATR